MQFILPSYLHHVFWLYKVENDSIQKYAFSVIESRKSLYIFQDYHHNVVHAPEHR